MFYTTTEQLFFNKTLFQTAINVIQVKETLAKREMTNV